MIVNKTKGKILVRETETAGSFFSKARGLMFRPELPRERGMLFTFETESRVGIWMLFMRFPIDLIYLDSGKRIIGIFENIKPVSLNPKTWKVYYPGAPASYVLEVSSGVVRETGTETGDVLEFDQVVFPDDEKQENGHEHAYQRSPYHIDKGVDPEHDSR